MLFSDISVKWAWPVPVGFNSNFTLNRTEINPESNLFPSHLLSYSTRRKTCFALNHEPQSLLLLCLNIAFVWLNNGKLAPGLLLHSEVRWLSLMQHLAYLLSEKTAQNKMYCCYK